MALSLNTLLMFLSLNTFWKGIEILSWCSHFSNILDRRVSLVSKSKNDTTSFLSETNLINESRRFETLFQISLLGLSMNHFDYARSMLLGQILLLL